MTIEMSRQAWVGTEPHDVRELIEVYGHHNYEVHEYRVARCDCGCSAFRLEIDDCKVAARRTCFDCGYEHPMCDSAEFWEQTQPERACCAGCGGDKHNIGVGFSLHEEGDVRWLYIGVRCVACGIFTCAAEWEVCYTPSRHLFDQV